MNCPGGNVQCPEKPGQTGGTGHARAYTQPGQCPVPVGVPFCLGDVPVEVPAVSFLDAAEKLLDGEVLTGWQRAFVVGCRRHVDAGRTLSEKQLGVLKKLADIASDAPVSPARAFAHPTEGAQ